MRSKLLIVLGVVLALAALGPIAAAQERPEPLPLDEAVALLASAGGIDAYPDANSVTVFDRTWTQFQKSGAYEEYNHALIKILTDEGIDENADYSVNYQRQYGSVEIILARVVKADGTEVVVGPDLITDGTPPQVAAMNIYETNFREKTVVFPNLEVGDGIEYLVHQTYEPLIEDNYNGFFMLQYVEPILETTVTITGPSDMPLKYLVKDGEAEFSQHTDGDMTVYSWTARDVPKIETEPGMVSPASIGERLLVSTIHTWQELSRYGWKISSEKCVDDATVHDLVADVTSGLSTTEDKIRAIHYWIIKNVRYLGISMDRGMFLEPHFAAYTIDKEYGVCRDKAVLMVTMLKDIGVPAWVTFVSPGRGTDPEIPNVFFEHGIVATKGPDGKYRFIDPTMETSREVYSPYIGDRWVLVATEEGEDIMKAPHVPASANSGEITDTSTLTADGLIAGSVVITGRGMYEEILRTIANQAGQEQMRMLVERMVQDIYPGARLTDFTLSDPEDLYEPLTITIGYEIDDYALDADPYLLFHVPSASGDFDILARFVLGRYTGLETRKYPMALGTTLGTLEDGLVAVPDGYTSENLPDEVDFESGAIGLTIKYEFVPAESADSGAHVRYSKVLSLDSYKISPEDYLALKEAVRLASRSTKGEVILKRQEG
jgi:transglutaminase-like putative cysteine protease